MRDFFISDETAKSYERSFQRKRMNNIKEGELYKIVELHGHRIELRYGYYEEFERERGEPIPIYPDLRETPIYTEDGFPIVTQMQDLCENGKCRFSDGCCGECEYFSQCVEMFGICTNTINQIQNNNRKEQTS